jgi:hypothetical protein
VLIAHGCGRSKIRYGPGGIYVLVCEINLYCFCDRTSTTCYTINIKTNGGNVKSSCGFWNYVLHGANKDSKYKMSLRVEAVKAYADEREREREMRR